MIKAMTLLAIYRTTAVALPAKSSGYSLTIPKHEGPNDPQGR